MKSLFTILVMTLAGINLASAGETKPSYSVSFGRHAKVTCLPSERDRVQKFYRNVLHSQVFAVANRDHVQLGNDYYITYVYEDSAPSEVAFAKSVWLEVSTDNPDALKKAVIDFGIKEFKTPDEHFSFQAPGGLGFRIWREDEDVSQSEGKHGKLVQQSSNKIDHKNGGSVEVTFHPKN
jgi:hypothetical protein